MTDFKAPQPAPTPVLYLSAAQVQGVIDFTLEPAGTHYLPFSREREGLFTVPVYIAAGHPVFEMLARFRADQVDAEIPTEDLMPLDPAEAVAYLIANVREWQ